MSAVARAQQQGLYTLSRVCSPVLRPAPCCHAFALNDRAAAAVALLPYWCRQWVNKLIPMLSDKNGEVRRVAVSALCSVYTNVDAGVILGALANSNGANAVSPQPHCPPLPPLQPPRVCLQWHVCFVVAFAGLRGVGAACCAGGDEAGVAGSRQSARLTGWRTDRLTRLRCAVQATRQALQGVAGL